MHDRTKQRTKIQFSVASRFRALIECVRGTAILPGVGDFRWQSRGMNLTKERLAVHAGMILS